MVTLHRKTCEGCGIQFETRLKRSRFHSLKCWGQWRRRERFGEMQASGRKGGNARARKLLETLNQRLTFRLGPGASLADAYRAGCRDNAKNDHRNRYDQGFEDGYRACERALNRARRTA